MRVQRGAVTDVLTRDGETAVLVDGQAVRLGPLATEIWSLAAAPVRVADLAGELEHRLGAPLAGSALDTTKDAVASLLRLGVLRQLDQTVACQVSDSSPPGAQSVPQGGVDGNENGIENQPSASGGALGGPGQ